MPNIRQGGGVTTGNGPVNNSPTLSAYLDNSKRILILRRQGGVGDILMSRMLFYDIKKSAPGYQVFYGCPPNYWPLVQDHPYIDGLLDCFHIPHQGFGFISDITDRAGQYEATILPFVDKHRTDIWAGHIGIKLSQHEGYLRFTEDEFRWGRNKYREINPKSLPTCLISPKTAHPGKDLPLGLMRDVCAGLSELGYLPIYFGPGPLGLGNNVVSLTGLALREWMVLTSFVDTAITAATGTYNLLNLLHKPTVACFGCEDLNIYGKYFPEMIPVQRHRQDDNGWDNCPCWCCWQCSYKTPGVYPPACIESFTADEILSRFERLVGIDKPRKFTINRPIHKTKVKQQEKTTQLQTADKKPVITVATSVEKHISLEECSTVDILLALPGIERLAGINKRVVIYGCNTECVSLFKYFPNILIDDGECPVGVIRLNNANSFGKDPIKLYAEQLLGADNAIGYRGVPLIPFSRELSLEWDRHWFTIAKNFIYCNVPAHHEKCIVDLVIRNKKRFALFCRDYANLGSRTHKIPENIEHKAFVIGRCCLVITNDPVDVCLGLAESKRTLFLGELKYNMGFYSNNIEIIDCKFDDANNRILDEIRRLDV